MTRQHAVIRRLRRWPRPLAFGRRRAGRHRPQAPVERDFLSRIRRLTVEGRRAGEGYWAPNGQSLVFQSEREPGNPFYQIYRLDLATGTSVRISPGLGKTTCSFINPVTDDVLFASTHHDPRSKQLQDEELAFRASRQGTALLVGLRPGDGTVRARRRRRARCAG